MKTLGYEFTTDAASRESLLDKGFFDPYPRFYSTSATGARPNRLNRRHQALIESNGAIIRGKSVLDIASHDGRWSFAAHKAGAEHVLGIEAREPLVKSAQATMQEYQVPEDRCHFILGDVFDEISQLAANSIDTILCFGFYYHTMRHMRLLSEMARLRPRHVIFDTEITLDPGSTILIKKERIALEGAGVSPPRAILPTPWLEYPVGLPSS